MTKCTDESNRIVELKASPAAAAVAADRLGDLLTMVRDILLRRIQALVASLFDNVDDALFDLAGKADNSSIQTGYFDSMRDVRRKRQRVGRRLQQLLTDGFNDFAAGQSTQKAERDAQSHVDMHLIDHIELEESLAIASMVAKAESRLAPQLFATCQRLSMLRGGAKVDNANNPVAPAFLCQSFRAAMHDFDLNDRSRLMIYKLFERYVMAGIDAMYDEVNARLVQAGVLPHVRHTLPHDASSIKPTLANGVTEHPKMPAHDALDPSRCDVPQPRVDPIDAQLQAEIYTTVCSLLASRRGPAVIAQQPPDYLAGKTVQHSVPVELISALGFLQLQGVLAQQHASSAADAAHVVQQIKQELLDQADKVRGKGKVPLAVADEDTIDLIGMLFEFVLQDRNLLAPMQALLGRLQIPFLKVALLDKHWFAQKNHPARQLLNCMAQACIGWSEESDRDLRLHDRVKQSVESLLKDFGDNPSIFERTRVDFETFLDANKRRADLAEQRAAQVTSGREKLNEARRTSAREILKRVNGKHLPDIIYNVLTRPWANYLVLTLLRQGKDCEEWHDALQFADAFAWSGEPKTSDAERARLTRMLPELERSLRKSLGIVAYQDTDLKQLLHELNLLYSDILKGASTAPACSSEAILGSDDPNALGFTPANTAAATAAAVESAVEEMVTRGDVDAETQESAGIADDECLEQARAMKVGAWIEFTSPDTTTKQRAKLSWISPISGKYLFVNRMGLKVSDKTVIALAAEIRRGVTLILEELPLFDRALDAVIRHLKVECTALLAE